MLEFISPNTRFDFVGIRRPAIALSLLLCALGIGLLFWPGAQLGIDFAGGSLVQVRFKTAKAADQVRAAAGAAGVGVVDVQDLGRESTEFLIRVPLSAEGSESVNKRVTAQLAETFGVEEAEIRRVEAVGPRVGEALRWKAMLAVIFATFMMGVYIWLRFEWRFGVGAAAALAHDLLVAVTFLIVFGYEFDLTIIAALLTVVGFSVNDTVIISDRIRENRRKDRRSPLATVINQSINETLSRTILTTGTAVLVTLALFVLGGTVIHGFAFTLLVGFVVGTYSSIFISSPIVLFFEPAAATTPERREGRASSTAAARRT